MMSATFPPLVRHLGGDAANVSCWKVHESTGCSTPYFSATGCRPVLAHVRVALFVPCLIEKCGGTLDGTVHGLFPGTFQRTTASGLEEIFKQQLVRDMTEEGLQLHTLGCAPTCVTDRPTSLKYVLGIARSTPCTQKVVSLGGFAF